MNKEENVSAPPPSNHVIADEMFPEGSSSLDNADSSVGYQPMEICMHGNEKMLHSDFYNDFGDLFEEKKES